LQEGIETVDAAYEVFLIEGFENFEGFAFELKTTATKSLQPSRIREYLEIIFEQQGVAACQAVLEYVVVVLAKYLQMMVAYEIHRQKTEWVTAQFEQFNMNYNELVHIFAQITGEQFKPGAKPAPQKRVAAVRPVPRKVEDRSGQQLQAFLGKCSLGHLGEGLGRRGVTLEDLLEISDDEEMMSVGIKAYKDRKKLQKAIHEHKAPKGGAR
jgi:hypothetical protein